MAHIVPTCSHGSLSKLMPCGIIHLVGGELSVAV